MYHHGINAQNVEKSGFQSLPVEHCIALAKVSQDENRLVVEYS